MITITPSQAQERYLSLPPILQEAVFSPKIAEALGSVAERNGLDEGDTSELADVLGLVLLGFLRPENLEEELADHFDLDQSTIEKLAAQLNSSILNQFRGSLEKIYAPPEEAEQELAAPVPLADITPEEPALMPAAPAQEISPEKPEPAQPLETFSAPPVAESAVPRAPGMGAFSIEETPPGPPNFPKTAPTEEPVTAPQEVPMAAAAQTLETNRPEAQAPPSEAQEAVSEAPVVLNTEFQAEPITLGSSFASGAFGTSAGDQLKELGDIPRPPRIEAQLEMETTPAAAGATVPEDKGAAPDVSPLIHYDQPKPFDFGQQETGSASLNDFGAPPVAAATPQEGGDNDHAAPSGGFLHSFLSSLKSSKKEIKENGNVPGAPPVVKEVNYSADAAPPGQEEPPQAGLLGVPPENVIDMKNTPAPGVPPLPDK